MSPIPSCAPSREKYTRSPSLEIHGATSCPALDSSMTSFTAAASIATEPSIQCPKQSGCALEPSPVPLRGPSPEFPVAASSGAPLLQKPCALHCKPLGQAPPG